MFSNLTLEQILLVITGALSLTSSLFYVHSLSNRNITKKSPLGIIFIWSQTIFWFVLGYLLYKNTSFVNSVVEVIKTSDFRAAVGLTAGVLSIIAFIPYIYSILKGKTKPARSTWFIWSIVTIMLFISYRAIGGGDAVWLSLGYVIGVGATALLSIKYGTGGWTTLDKTVIGGCALTVITWFLTGLPFVGLLMTMFTDILGGVPTIEHSYHHPEQENRLSWIIGFAANGLNLLAIEKWDFIHAAYPIYLFLMVGIITELVLNPLRKKRKAKKLLLRIAV